MANLTAEQLKKLREQLADPSNQGYWVDPETKQWYTRDTRGSMQDGEWRQNDGYISAPHESVNQQTKPSDRRTYDYTAFDDKGASSQGGQLSATDYGGDWKDILKGAALLAGVAGAGGAFGGGGLFGGGAGGGGAGGLSELGLAGEGAFGTTNALGGAGAFGPAGTAHYGLNAALMPPGIGGSSSSALMPPGIFDPVTGAALPGMSGVAEVGAGAGLSTAAKTLGGASSLLGPAVTLAGGLLGAKGNKNETSVDKRMDPRLDGPVFGANGIVPRSEGLLAEQMTPEGQAGWRQMQKAGQGLLSQPIAGNGFHMFYGRK